MINLIDSPNYCITKEKRQKKIFFTPLSLLIDLFSFFFFPFFIHFLYLNILFSLSVYTQNKKRGKKTENKNACRFFLYPRKKRLKYYQLKKKRHLEISNQNEKKEMFLQHQYHQRQRPMTTVKATTASATITTTTK